MTLPAQDIVERLRKAMDGVTPGPWHTERMEMSRTASVQRLYVAGPSDVVSPHDGVCEPDRYNDRSFREDDANMRYIALCSPDNIGALLNTISRLTADNEALRNDIRIGCANIDKEIIARLTAESRADALAQEVERLRETLRAVKQWTLFELRDNATRQPWRRRLEAIDAALGDRP